MNKNKGYSLVELLIVVAIMAILCGLAAVSVGVIKKARAQEAVQTFNSQLSNIWLQTKSVASTQDSMYAEIVENANNEGYVMKLYDLVGGTVVDKNISGNSMNNDGNVTVTNGVTINKYVTITYTPTVGDASQDDDNITGKFIIKFDKSTGAVLRGAGTYDFQDTTGSVIATVHLDAVTGNHYIK